MTEPEHPRADAPAPAPEGGLLRRPAAQLQARLRPLVRLAEAIVGKVRVQTWLTLASAVWLWGLIFFPFSSFGTGWVVGLAVGVLLLFTAPAAVLWLFWLGLRQLTRVPDRLVEIAGAGEDHARDLLETAAGKTEPRKARRLWRFFRTVLDLRKLILESKDLLWQFAAVARVANPVFVVALFVAFVASLLLMAAAAVSFLFVLLF